MPAQSESSRTCNPQAAPGTTSCLRAEVDNSLLLRQFQEGDSDAFATLLRRYQAQVYGYLCRCGVPEGARDDLFQEIFLKVNGASARFDCQRPFRPWLFAIVVNAVRSHLRKHHRNEVDVDECAIHSVGPGGDEIVAARETEQWLERAIAQLPIAQREVLILICVQSMDAQEVAAALSTSPATVKTNLRRGRLALARRLANRNARAENETRKVVSQ